MRPKVILGEIITAAENLKELLTKDDLLYINELTSPKRKREVCAWRALLRDNLREMCRIDDAEADIRYNSVGAPYIVDSEINISVSHSATMVAVMLSSEPCAIDIEELSRDFAKVASRYVSSEEEQLKTSNETPLFALLWSAKEALYKISGTEGLDLKEDLIIESINNDNYTLRGIIKPQNRVVELAFNIVEGLMIVHTA